MVSILLTTYKRLPFLKRAVEDVYAQTYTDWELVISDDEIGEGETWVWLKDISSQDSRVHIVKNSGPRHGQVWNVNNALQYCEGDWIKPFFDDDRMLPECLEKMMAAANKWPSAAMIGCRAQKWRNGEYVGDEKDFCRGKIDMIRRQDCLRAICLFDRWNGRTPTHMLINRDAVIGGAVMPVDDAYHVPVDWVWFARVLLFGDYVMLREPLVCQCEGEVASVTSGARADEYALDRELFAAYRDIYDIAKNDMQKISWRDIEAQINGIRGIYHLSQLRVGRGMVMMVKALKSIRAPAMVLRWLLQEIFPSRFSATAREDIG